MLSRLLLASALSFTLSPAVAAATQPAPPTDPREQDIAEDEEDAIVITATRTATPLSSVPAMVTLIDEEAIEQQRLIATDTSSLLGNLVPGFAPSRQKLSTFGESFRGRAPLYLIDGVPQSNPLRSGSRESYTIDLAVVERIEVINGANAIQGLGATGGIVNFVTRRPDPSGDWRVGASAAVTADDGFSDDGFEYRGSVYATRDFGAVDFIGAASYHRRGLFFDGEGRSIAVDATQGDLADSEQRNFFGKIGWEPDANQRLQLTVNDFRLGGLANWSNEPGNRAIGLPATAREGAPPGEPPLNEVNTISLDYRHRNLLGADATIQLFRQDFAAIYGGGTFAVFQDPALAPVGTLFDQSQNLSLKHGARATFNWRDVFGTRADITSGLDYLNDTTSQRLIHTGRNWVPETTYEAWSPFVQVDLPLTDWLTAAGGLRWENATLTVDDYRSLAGNRADRTETPVIGGSPSFDQWLANASLIVEPVHGVSLYGSFSQGYTIPDVGRVLRAVNVPGTRVDDLLALSPVIADNYELGLTVRRRGLVAQFAYFISASEQGSRLVADADGIFSVVRQKTRVQGFEASVEAALGAGFRAGGNLSLLTGRVDANNDGDLDADLDAINIGPDRLNLYVSYATGPLSARLQSATLFDRAFENAAGLNTANFEGYTAFDLFAGYDVGVGTVSLGVQNLTDEQYITYYGQAGSTLGEDYFAGRGRTYTLGFTTEF